MASSTLDASFVLVNREPVPRASLEAILETTLERAHHGGKHRSSDPSYSVGSSASFAHDWSKEGTGGKLRIHGRHIVDTYGRVCNLRGVNVGGGSKTPANGDHAAFPSAHTFATFVGRPFPIKDAPEHLARLRRWGLTFIRFLVTWEAIEHDGPGIYDMEYLTYIHNLLSLLPKYGMVALVEVHQDVWSRYSGGSGAPAWTLEAVGFDLDALHDSGAAWLLGVKGGGHAEDERGVWPCGYQRLAPATMATLFWAGDVFAPKLRVKGRDGIEVSIQQYLQDAFLDMYDTLVRTVGHLDGVIGFEALNEPHTGFINLPSMHSYNYNTDLHLGFVPSALQSFMLGSGIPTDVAYWTRAFPMPTSLTSHRVLNPGGRKAWRADGPTGGRCLWEMHEVWGWDEGKKKGVVLRENYFVKHPMTGQKIDWYTDFYYPFLHKWASRVRAASPRNHLLFVEAIPNEFCPESWTPERQLPNMVYAPHWYDLKALFEKSFGDITVNIQGLSRGMSLLKAFYWGQRGARENYALQIRNIVEAGYKSLGDVPIIISECGVPIDMNKGEAFKTENWKWQSRMMDAMMTALERSLVGVTLWNYNPDNNDQKGDDWNGENFSWFSRGRGLPPSVLCLDQTSPTLDNGARILPAIVRPYPAKTAGIPLHFEYEVTTGCFVFEWADVVAGGAVAGKTHAPLTSRESEIFVPSLLTHGRKLIVDGLGSTDTYSYDEARQTLFILVGEPKAGAVHKISVRVEPPVDAIFTVNGFWGDFGGRLISLFIILVGIMAHRVFA